MPYTGIDYGSTTQSNRNIETGIHYGVIAQNSVLQAWTDNAEPDYGSPTCPKCGAGAIAYGEGHEEYEQEHGCADYACNTCKISFDSQDAYPEEALSWSYKDAEYKLTTCLYTNIFVLESPFYTYAAFCSPCVPGAGDLEFPDESGAKTYCLGHAWFEGGKAPYPVYRVSDNSLVTPE